VFDTVNIRMRNRIIIDYFNFMFNQNFKVSPSTRCVSAASAIGKVFDVFSENNKITLTDIL
jgi:hypothetical protein